MEVPINREVSLSTHSNSSKNAVGYSIISFDNFLQELKKVKKRQNNLKII